MIKARFGGGGPQSLPSEAADAQAPVGPPRANDPTSMSRLELMILSGLGGRAGADLPTGTDVLLGCSYGTGRSFNYRQPGLFIVSLRTGSRFNY